MKWLNNHVRRGSGCAAISILAIEHPSFELRYALDAVWNHCTGAVFDPFGLYNCAVIVLLEIGDLVGSECRFNYPFAPQDVGFDKGLGVITLEFSDQSVFLALGAVFSLIPFEFKINLAARGSLFFQNNTAVLRLVAVNIPIIPTFRHFK